MKSVTAAPVIIVALVLAQAMMSAVTLTFDDVPQGAQVGEHYAPLGVHFDLTDFGVQEGLANGDSGNWGLNGTSGPFFDGCNGASPGTYSMTLTFDAPVTLFSLDASRSNGSDSKDTLSVSGFFGATLVDTKTITFSRINSWANLSLAGTFERVQWSGGGSSFHPYGLTTLTLPSFRSLARFPSSASARWRLVTGGRRR